MYILRHIVFEFISYAFSVLLYLSHMTTMRNQKNLADKFNISKSYFSEYFKKQAGISLINYILKSKLKIVETKILHTDLSLKEIAWQLNFTDSSHLARSFKKEYGMTIKEFKNRGNSCCS